MPERRWPRAQRPSLRAPLQPLHPLPAWRLEALAALDLLEPRLRVLWAVALPRLLLLPRVPPHRVAVLRPRPVEELPLLLLLPVSLALESPRPRRLARRRAALVVTLNLLTTLHLVVRAAANLVALPRPETRARVVGRPPWAALGASLG